MVPIEPLCWAHHIPIKGTITGNVVFNHILCSNVIMVLFRFYAEIIKEKVLIERSTRVKQPAHRIILYPSVKLVNLLPVDMQYVLAGEKGIVKAGQQAAFTHVSKTPN